VCVCVSERDQERERESEREREREGERESREYFWELGGAGPLFGFPLLVTSARFLIFLISGPDVQHPSF